MRVAIGSDHAGYEAKQRVVTHLRTQGHDVADLGTYGTESVDYPDFANKVAEAVRNDEVERGVLICGSGIGVCIAANKVPGIRAGYAFDATSARLAREHNDAQIVCLGARLLDEAAIRAIVDVFLGAEYEGGRHDGRIEKIHGLETNNHLRSSERDPE